MNATDWLRRMTHTKVRLLTLVLGLREANFLALLFSSWSCQKEELADKIDGVLTIKHYRGDPDRWTARVAPPLSSARFLTHDHIVSEFTSISKRY